MWARVRLDIGWRDIACGLRSCLRSRDGEQLTAQIEGQWSERGDALVSFSVRTGFDLLLQALALPEGSRILFTALNIKGMVKIARRHGLVPVPIDLDPDSMAPDLAALERAITDDTRAIVLAPLFGTRGQFDELIEAAREHDLIVVEDAAQAFSGVGYAGHEGAHVSLFSFGPLKFATALGGALLTVRDPQLLARMRALQGQYPVQATRDNLLRLLKFAALKAATSRAVMAAVALLFRVRGQDYEEAVAEPARGVAKLGSSRKIRHRCSPALLTLLQRRLSSWRLDPARDAAAGLLRRELHGSVGLPAIDAPHHSHWAFPIVVEHPAEVMRQLRTQGFDAATLGRSAAVPAPDGEPELAATRAAATLEGLVVLPCYPAMSEAELLRLAAAVREAVKA
jgi:dTDP-4-amino-4,6-dideoxygalactose transaminase